MSDSLLDRDYSNQTAGECAAKISRDFGSAAGNYVAGRWLSALLLQQARAEVFWRSVFVMLVVNLTRDHSPQQIAEFLAGGIDRLEAQQQTGPAVH